MILGMFMGILSKLKTFTTFRKSKAEPKPWRSSLTVFFLSLSILATLFEEPWTYSPLNILGNEQLNYMDLSSVASSDLSLDAYNRDHRWGIMKALTPEPILIFGTTDELAILTSSNIHTAREIKSLPHGDGISSTVLAITPDGNYMVSGAGDGTIVLWDVHSGIAVSTPQKVHTKQITSLSFRSDFGNHLISASSDQTVRLWMRVQSNLMPKMDPKTDNHITFAPGGIPLSTSSSSDGNLFGVGYDTGITYLLDPSNLIILRQLIHEGEKNFIRSIAFNPHRSANSPDTFLFASGLGNGCLNIWSGSSDPFELWRRPNICGDAGNPVLAAEFSTSADGFLLCFAQYHRSLRLWEIQIDNEGIYSSEPYWSEKVKTVDQITSLSFSSDSQVIAIGQEDGWIQFFSTQDERELVGVERLKLQSRVGSIVFSNDGGWFAVSSKEGIHIYGVPAVDDVGDGITLPPVIREEDQDTTPLQATASLSTVPTTALPISSTPTQDIEEETHLPALATPVPTSRINQLLAILLDGFYIIALLIILIMTILFAVIHWYKYGGNYNLIIKRLLMLGILCFVVLLIWVFINPDLKEGYVPLLRALGAVFASIGVIATLLHRYLNLFQNFPLLIVEELGIEITINTYNEEDLNGWIRIAIGIHNKSSKVAEAISLDMDLSEHFAFNDDVEIGGLDYLKLRASDTGLRSRTYKGGKREEEMIHVDGKRAITTIEMEWVPGIPIYPLIVEYKISCNEIGPRRGKLKIPRKTILLEVEQTIKGNALETTA